MTLRGNSLAFTAHLHMCLDLGHNRRFSHQPAEGFEVLFKQRQRTVFALAVKMDQDDRVDSLLMLILSIVFISGLLGRSHNTTLLA